MGIAVSAEDHIAISCDVKHCIWKHAEAIGHGKDGAWVSWRRVSLWFISSCQKMERAQYQCDADPRNTNCKGWNCCTDNRCDIFSRQRGGGYCFCQILWAKEDWRKMMEEARLHVCHVRCTLSLHSVATTSCFQAASLFFTDCNAIVYTRPPRTS